MTLLSITAYAETHSMKRQAVQNWIKRGFITLSGKLVDVRASDEALRKAGLGRFKSAAATAAPAPATSPRNSGRNKKRNKSPVAPEVVAVIDEVVADFKAAAEDDEIDEAIATGFIEELLAGQFRSKVEAVAIKENALALKHLLAAQKEASKLVEIEVAEAVIFDDRRAARDAWMAFPSRFAPLLAADLDIDGATLAEALKPYVHQQLDELGEPDLDFTAVES